MNSKLPAPTFHVVIVNWNAGGLLADCIHSFEAISGDAVTLSRITVVDNDSTDNSLAALEAMSAKFPLEIVRNDTNKGFAAACNQGARDSRADFLLFLNPDTRLSAGALETPARFLAEPDNSHVGIVGIQLVDGQGHIARTCARQPTVWSILGQSLGLDRLGLAIFPTHFVSDWNHGDTRAVDQVMGAFFLIRNSLFQNTGGFDERFFVYFEDMDMAVRARDLGWTSAYVSTARVFHRGKGTTEQVKDLRLFYFWRSRVLYTFKHFNMIGAVAILLATLSVEPLVRTIALLANKRRREIGSVLRATCLLWSNLPKIMRADTRSAAV
jgi:GT2 family glycosyltransferase